MERAESGPPSSLACTFGRDLDAPRAARNLVVRSLGPGAAPGLVRDAQLVVSELVANVLQHTFGGGALRVAASGRGLRIEVDDATNDPPVLLAALGSVLPHGRGMRIVAGLSDAWGVEGRLPHGKTVWAEVSE